MDLTAKRSAGGSLLTGLLERIGVQNVSLLIALILLLAIFGAIRPEAFFSGRNIINIGLAVTVIGILAMAQTVVIISGGLDISVGSIVGLTTMVIAVVAQTSGSIFLAVTTGLAAGLLAGAGNGAVIVFGPVNAVIATLGSMSAYRGLAYLLNNGNSIPIVDDGFRMLGTATLFSVPFAIWLLLALMLITIVMLQNTTWGRNIYALGGNRVVARLAGIHINGYQIGIYAASGLAAGIAGIVLASRTMSGQPASGSQGLEMEAITAAVLGGCALQGGKGSVISTMLGVLIIGTLNNGMILTSVPTFYQLLAKGALLVLAVIVQERRQIRSDN
ncbi:ABC transporter permease [Bradyrhizobium sp. CCBAU 53338]|uniref:ABC transporter permease n=1 Tax=Bradyrhizobium sp. CCBAU 53338 TaxID=1325111 RepID=UPI00188CE28B|nr:ABC transporter permease [Bradyrhizobium sp. CCBAU 53338]QOZ52486.1 ABC transporter permease [Bradyrhizobium sp. CCBAU 53338]